MVWQAYTGEDVVSRGPGMTVGFTEIIGDGAKRIHIAAKTEGHEVQPPSNKAQRRVVDPLISPDCRILPSVASRVAA